MTSPSPLAASSSLVWLILDEYTTLVILVVILVGVISGGMLAMGGADTTELDTIGEITLTMEPPPTAGTPPANVSVAGDGLIPLSVSESVAVSARYHRSHDTVDASSLTVIISVTVMRSTSDGTLWEIDEAIASAPVADDLTVEVDISELQTLAATIDERLQTESGSVGIEVSTRVIDSSGTALPAEVSSQIAVINDHLRFDPSVATPVRAPVSQTTDAPRWPWLTLVLSILLLGVLAYGRLRGSLPFDVHTRRSHRRRWALWYYRRYVIQSWAPTPTTAVVQVSDLDDLLRLAKRSQRVINCNREGVLWVDIDGRCYLWSTTPRVQDR